MRYEANIDLFDIEKGTRLAITFRDGTRLAGTANGRVKETRHQTLEFRVRPFAGKGLDRVDTETVASIIAL